MKAICKICSKVFNNKTNGIYCSDECKRLASNKRVREWRIRNMDNPTYINNCRVSARKSWYKNKDKYLPKNREYNKKYYKENKDKVLERTRNYRLTHPEINRKSSLKYYYNNQEELLYKKKLNGFMNRSNCSFRISDLCHFAYCPRRSKLQSFSLRGYSVKPNKAMIVGTQMHESYSSWSKSFYRLKLLYDLRTQFGQVLEREVDGYKIRGVFDDLQVLLHYKSGKYINYKTVRIVEVKTTSKKYPWSNDYASAIMQVKFYAWLVKPYLEKLGYTLHHNHLVEFYSQKNKKLIKRIIVPYEDMEDTFRVIIETWQGLRKMTLPEKWICKHCPRHIKIVCGRYGSSK